VRFKVYRYGEPMMLSAVLPVLHSLGVQVVDERPYEIRRNDGTIYLYDFGLRPPTEHRELAEVRPQVENAFAAAWRGEAEVDGFNELVLRAGLTWRQVVVLRAYAKYQRQAGSVFSQRYSSRPSSPTRRSPGCWSRSSRPASRPGWRPASRSARGWPTRSSSGSPSLLDGVDSLDQDRILRSYLTLIRPPCAPASSSAARTAGRSLRGVQARPAGDPRPAEPRPKYEIFVYSPRFEGVHLRFGAVARGGLRWSDRREDFRTESSAWSRRRW
jgi:glutamate dehydrogenase